MPSGVFPKHIVSFFNGLAGPLIDACLLPGALGKIALQQGDARAGLELVFLGQTGLAVNQGPDDGQPKDNPLNEERPAASRAA